MIRFNQYRILLKKRIIIHVEIYCSESEHFVHFSIFDIFTLKPFSAINRTG